jgi:hypothetical protein
MSKPSTRKEVERLLSSIKPGKDNYQCKYCDYEYQNIPTGKHHARYEHFGEIYQYKCDQCKFAWSTLPSLNKHIIDMHKVESVVY